MEIAVNGEARRLDRMLTVTELLVELGLEPKKIAVERNLEIVPKSRFDVERLADGDRIEIVQFVGGGGRKERRRS